MKILICGLPGTGKTSISQKISDRFDCRLISDWDIFAKYNIEIDKFEDKNILSGNYSKLILDYVNNLQENIVVDLEYSISPRDFLQYNKHEDVSIIYLGFDSVGANQLFELFRKSEANVKYSDEELKSQIEFFKKMSIEFKKQCDNYGFKFFDINTDRNIIQQEILDYLNIHK